jgi:hypothetical protein
MDGLYLLGMHYLKLTEEANKRALDVKEKLEGLGNSVVYDESSGEGRALATFQNDLPGRETAREVATAARHTARASKSKQSLKQRQKEAELNGHQLDLEKEV